jgi:hypothetical protein
LFPVLHQEGLEECGWLGFARFGFSPKFVRREATERYNNHQFASNSNVPACSTGREGDISLEGIIAIYEAAGLAGAFVESNRRGSLYVLVHMDRPFTMMQSVETTTQTSKRREVVVCSGLWIAWAI